MRVASIISAIFELVVMGIAGGTPSLRSSLTSVFVGVRLRCSDFLSDVLTSCNVGVRLRCSDFLRDVLT